MAEVQGSESGNDVTTASALNTTVNMTTNTTCINDYCESMDDYYDRLYNNISPDTGEWILIGVYLVTFLVGLFGNCLVCFAIWRNQNMRTVTNIFIVNLSVADLAVIIVCMPSTLLVDVTLTWFLGTVLCKIHVFLMTLCVSLSVLTLTAISVERWYAICHPLRFHSTVERARVIIAIIWILSIVIALPELIFSDVIQWKPFTIIFSSCYPSLMASEDLVVFQICLMVGLYFIPISLMAFTYTHIAIVLINGHIPGESRSAQPMLSGSHHHDNDDQMEARKKAAKMLCAIVIVFALCFFPNHLLNIFRYTGYLDTISHPDTFALIAHWAAFLNSCINPVIYNFMSDKFRKEFRQTVGWCVRCKCGKRQESYYKTDQYKVTFTRKETYLMSVVKDTHAQRCQ